MVKTENVMAKLSMVMEPELHQDLVSLNMVEDVEIIGDTVKLKIILTTPACPLKKKIEADVKNAVLSIEGVKNVNVVMDARVVSDGKTREMLKLPIRNAIAIASGKAE